MTQSPATQAAAAELRVGSLYAEYSLAQVDSIGNWVAVGTVTKLGAASRRFWILAGTGATPQAAVANLRAKMAQAAAKADAEPPRSDSVESG